MVFMQLLSSALFTVISNRGTNVRREDRDKYKFLQEKKVTEREGGGREEGRKRERMREVPMYQGRELISVESALWRL